MNQLTKRIIAGTMAFAMLCTAAPISNYLGIRTAITASAANNKYVDNYESTSEFHIATLDDLNLFAEAVNGGKDFEGKIVYLDADIGDEEHPFTTPIGISYYDPNLGGSVQNFFRGTFDGQGNTVNLNIITQVYLEVPGLFGYAESAVIRNVIVTGSLTGGRRVGGICGCAINTKIYNCGNKASITTDDNEVGGIAGVISAIYDPDIGSSSIYNCFNVGEIHSGCNYAGGIVSRAEYNDNNIATAAYIHNCCNMANVSANYRSHDGIVHSWDSEPPQLEVVNCFSVAVADADAATIPAETTIDSEMLAGTKPVKDDDYLIDLLNNYVDEFNSNPKNAGIELVKWTTDTDGSPKLLFKEPSKIDEVPVTALGSNVTINDSLNMNFFMDIPDDLKNTATIMASVNGGEAKELTPVLVDGTKYKVTVENISAKDAAEPIKFYAVDKTDNTKLLSEEFETSIEDYLVSVYEAADEEGNNYPESTKSFVLSILNYCDTAEKYFNLSTTTDFTLSKIDNFADKYALIAKTSSEVLNADNIKNAKTTPDALTNAEKYRYWGSTLLLKSKLALRQYYKAENGADITGFDGCKSDIELYYFEKTNISPTMLDTNINGYSILSYIKQVLSDDSSDASLKNVCTALYNYSEWAKQYQLDLKDDDET